MTEQAIDNLPEKDYSKKPRRQSSFEGEKSAIRLIDPKDKIDMQRYREIQDVLGEEFTDIDLTDEELIKEVESNRPHKKSYRKSLYIFGVSGSTGIEHSENEIGELQGWINVYQDEYVPQLVKQGKISQSQDKNMVLNVAIARHPKAQSGQMASGLRQVCTFLSQTEAFRQQDTSKTEPELIITAYASNIESEHVLSAAGFKNQGDISLTYAETKEIFNYKLYVLDWQELNKIMHQNADKEILASK